MIDGPEYKQPTPPKGYLKEFGKGVLETGVFYLKIIAFSGVAFIALRFIYVSLVLMGVIHPVAQ
jgi:hypothetical protein